MRKASFSETLEEIVLAEKKAEETVKKGEEKKAEILSSIPKAIEKLENESAEFVKNRRMELEKESEREIKKIRETVEEQGEKEKKKISSIKISSETAEKVLCKLFEE